MGGDPGVGIPAHVGRVHDSVAGTITPYLNGVAQTPVNTTVATTRTSAQGLFVGGDSNPWLGYGFGLVLPRNTTTTSANTGPNVDRTTGVSGTGLYA
ncbi:MAG: hypothetical protein KDB53_06900 [Planctomycetes bacterium]|nr:hypothetical protein [Planctomycetota bacterium]